MIDRFTRKSRQGRGSIPKQMRREIYERDSYTCQFCNKVFSPEHLTIDHLIPLARGGLDEPTNWVTACRSCNQQKADKPLEEFAASLEIDIESLPVHGDSVIDNHDLPIQLRMIRKRIFDRTRKGLMRIRGTSAQKKLEKAYRRELWQTSLGQMLEKEFPTLPGHVRAMIPEIETIAKDAKEFLLLVELAKSAQTRNLIGTVLTADSPIVDRVRSLAERGKNPSLERRLRAALTRFEKAVARLDKGDRESNRLRSR